MTAGPHPGASRPIQTRVADRLLAEGRITREAYESAVNHFRRSGGRIEESLLEVQAIDEATLMQWIAAAHQTRFVTTDKLARAEIDPAAIARVPRKIAEKYFVCPVVYDAQANALQIITADPDDVVMLDQVRLAAGVREVKTCVARPAAAKAVMRKHYLGDQHAFTMLGDQNRDELATLMNAYDRNVISADSMSIALVDATLRERSFSGADLERHRRDEAPMSTATSVVAGETADNFAETLNVLISIIENARPDLRGHSAQVARLVRKLGERIGLSKPDLASAVVAAYLHDLGKHGPYHLTTLNVSEYDGHRAIAEKSYHVPRRLMETVALTATTVATLESMYERYDGKGLPAHHGGKDIPVGARILAIADSYADLVQNPRNPAKRVLRPLEALDALARHKGTIFDPNLVDLFRGAVSGDDIRARILANRRVALVVDADVDETTVLELRLIEQGFEVRIARTSDQARAMLETGEIEIVVSELDLSPQDGLELLSDVRKEGFGRDLPWLVLTRRKARADAQRGFDLGVIDYVMKPAVTDVLVAKLRQALEKRAPQAARGVSGSLAEMSLSDLVQVLWHGRKSGALRVRDTRKESGEIHFVEGAIVNALWGRLRGEEAFYAVLALKDGDFSLDAEFRPPQVVITTSPESLLLEGMRRMDEGKSSG